MALTESTMLDLGTAAPEFALTDVVRNRTVRLGDFTHKGLLVMFLCRHCPYVKHIGPGLAALARDYAATELDIVAISSNDAAAYPDDAPDGLREMARELGFWFPYCYDETQQVAQAYRAACTPDFFLFDAAHKLVYRGQFDDARPGNGVPVTGRDLRMAIDAVLAGRPIAAVQRPSIGCNIKWKPGNAPARQG
jgi:thiol-disulfide isomerase/thioredoxin